MNDAEGLSDTDLYKRIFLEQRAAENQFFDGSLFNNFVCTNHFSSFEFFILCIQNSAEHNSFYFKQYAFIYL